MAILLPLIPVIGALVLAILKSIFGTDSLCTLKTIQVDGTPIGPQLAERLKTLGQAKQ